MKQLEIVVLTHSLKNFTPAFFHQHCTETALAGIANGDLMTEYAGNCTVLVFLYLSAAFGSGVLLSAVMHWAGSQAAPVCAELRFLC